MLDVGTRIENPNDNRRGTVGPVPEGERDDYIYVLYDEDLGQLEVQAYFSSAPEEALTVL